MTALIGVEASDIPAALDVALKVLIDWLRELHEPERSMLTGAFHVWVREVVAHRFPKAEAELTRIDELGGVRTMLSERMKEWTEWSVV